MKIKDIMNKPSEIKEIQTKEGNKISEAKSSSFQNYMQKATGNSFEEKIRNLANRIIEQGEKFEKVIDVRELKIYKSMISEFLNEIVSNSHKFSKETMLDRRGRYKVFAMVKKINKELDDLTEEVLASEKNNLNILKRIEDIRGLILDMIL